MDRAYSALTSTQLFISVHYLLTMTIPKKDPRHNFHNSSFGKSLYGATRTPEKYHPTHSIYTANSTIIPTNQITPPSVANLRLRTVLLS